MWGGTVSLIWALGSPNHMGEREMGFKHIWGQVMPPWSWQQKAFRTVVPECTMSDSKLRLPSGEDLPNIRVLIQDKVGGFRVAESETLKHTGHGFLHLGTQIGLHGHSSTKLSYPPT